MSSIGCICFSIDSWVEGQYVTTVQDVSYYATMIIQGRLEFDLVYKDIAVQDVSYNVTVTPSNFQFRKQEKSHWDGLYLVCIFLHR